MMTEIKWVNQKALIYLHNESLAEYGGLEAIRDEGLLESALLSLKLNYFKEISQGSATKFLTAVILNNLEIQLPLLEEQKAIASVLSCMDAKIENLRKQNETLEAIAQTLFKHWFINFEFPNDYGKPFKRVSE